MGVRRQNATKMHGHEQGSFRIAQSPLPLDALPTYGLMQVGASDPAIHRLPDSAELAEHEDHPCAVHPVCLAGRKAYKKDGLGRDEKKQFQRVEIAKRLPFSRYDLCSNPECFRGIEVVDL